jgi:alkaline phosphatase D
MKNSFVYKNDRPWPNPRLKRAVIIGHTTDQSARVWIRTAAPGNYTLLVYPTLSDPVDTVFKAFKTVPYEEIDVLPGYVNKFDFTVPDYGRDATHVVDVDQLHPVTEYRYALFGDDNGVMRILIGQDRPYRFRTLPAQDNSLSFGFYSCHMPYKHTLFGSTKIVNMEMWDCLNRVMARHYADDFRFLIAGGDQVYVDGVKTLDIWKCLNGVMRKENNQLFPSKEEMVSWYRDIYRGYWGFPAVKEAFAGYPTYMIWDDHELEDGWGSYYLDPEKKDEIDEIFPGRKAAKLDRADCMELFSRMQQAAFQVYEEYQHSHNPATPAGQYDYSFSHGTTSVYVLDGRGYRDINRRSRRILGSRQLTRFVNWLENLDPAATRYLFVVSAVPILHMTSVLANADDTVAADLADLQDDLRDSWEHDLHVSERRALLKALFDAANRGIKVSVLSGDVHAAAVFRMVHEKTGAVMYQLTSSAITYNIPRFLGWILGNTVPDEGKSKDGYRFERLALYTDSNFSVVRVDPDEDEVVFQLYGQQQVSHPDGDQEDKPMTHAIAKLKLTF